MTTPTELAALSYWRAMHAIRCTVKSPVDYALALDQLHTLANSGPPRVRAIVARRLKPVIVADDGGTVA